MCYRYRNGDRGRFGHREEGTVHTSSTRVQVADGGCNSVLHHLDSPLAVVSGQGPRGERRGADTRRTGAVSGCSSFLCGELHLRPEPGHAGGKESEGGGDDTEGEGGRRDR